ncbi:alpha/beta hydrolase [Okibacterium endophyticum]
MHGVATSADGTRIGYEKHGTGPCLILVTGATQYRAIDSGTRELARALADSFTVAVYDRRGRGESCDTPPYAVEREIEDIAALISMRGGEVRLFGHSSGAVLAVEAALAGLPISRLALYEPPLSSEDGGTSAGTESDDYERRLNEHIDAGRHEQALVQFMVEAVGLPPEVPEQMKQSPMWPDLVAVAPTLRYDHAIMDRVAGSALDDGRWRSVTQPALVIDGDASQPFMRAAAERAARALPNAERVTLPGQDHGASAEALAPVLRDWFTR